MSRLFTCGFEEKDFLNTMWSTSGGNALTLNTVNPHSGTYRADTSSSAGNSYIARPLAANKTSGTLMARFYFRTNTGSPSAITPIFQWFSSGPAQNAVIDILTDAKLRITNVVAGTSQSSTMSLTFNTWYRIEYQIKISDTVGFNAIRIYSDADVLLETVKLGTTDEITGSADTLPGAPSNYASFRVGKTGSTAIFSYDDIAINDEAGSSQNSFPIGPGKVALVAPVSNTSVTWLNEAGGSGSFNRIDETTGPFLASSFSGTTSQYLTFADLAAHDLTAAAAFTIAAVVRADSLPAGQYLVVHDNATTNVGWRAGLSGAHLHIEAIGQWGQNGTATTDLSSGVWYGVAWTRPAASTNVTYWRFRLDSQTMASETINNFGSTYADGASGGVIGGDWDGSIGVVPWYGKIAQVGIDVGTAHTSQELTDFFNNAATTTWDSRWDLPSLTDTGTAGATLTNVGTVSNDGLFNATTSTTNEDKFALTSLPSEVPSNAVMTLIDVYARVSAPDAVSGTMALKVWDEAGTGTQGPTMTVNSATWRIQTTDEHQVASLSGKTKANIGSYSIGYKALSGASRKAVTAEWANVEWTEGALTLIGATSTSSKGTTVPGIEVPL